MHIYPLLSDPVEIKKDADVWADFPALSTTIVPTNTIGCDFSIKSVSIIANNNTELGIYNIKIIFGEPSAEREYTTMMFAVTGKHDVCSVSNGHRVIPSNSRIAAKLSGNMAEEASVLIVIEYEDCFIQDEA